MSLTLGPIFDTPLHPRPWCDFGTDRGKLPECPRLDYRITGQYTDIDLINGGRHEAVDAGNLSLNHPIIAPAGGQVRSLHHFDGARGRELDLGAGYSLRLWHVAATASDPLRPASGTAAGRWYAVKRGDLIAHTGDTGLGTGAHTHIELWLNAKRLDPEPHLYVDGKPGKPIEGAPDEMASFTDVPEGHPFYHDIEWMAEKGITRGIPNGDGTFRFEPDKPTTRAQMAAFLRRTYDVILGEVD